MDEVYVTYVDDERVGDHGCDDNTHDHHDKSNDTYVDVSLIYR